MNKIDDREQSDIRLHCDNDNTKEDGGHWEPLPDPAGMPDEYINAKKPFEEQMQWDPVSQLFRKIGS